MPRLSAPRWTTVASAALGLLLAICLYRFGDDVRQYKSAQALKSEAQAELALLEARRDDINSITLGPPGARFFGADGVPIQ